MERRRAVAVVALLALAACGERTATQVLVRFEAGPESTARASLLRVTVTTQEGEVALERTVRLSGPSPDAQLPATVPVVPRGGDAERRFDIVGELIDPEGVAFARQRARTRFVADARRTLVLTFWDACLGIRCVETDTCVDGSCESACLEPAAAGSFVPVPCDDAIDAGIDAAICSSACERSEGASCVPVDDGTACEGGSCRQGACCGACWDDGAGLCRAGIDDDACGTGGESCAPCACPDLTCAAGLCIPAERPTALSLGLGATVARGATGALWTWGDDLHGQLGRGALGEDDPSPGRVGTRNWRVLDAGDEHACGVRNDRTLWCWGIDDRGQLGTGAGTGDAAAPDQASGATDWDQVSAGRGHSCAVKTTGQLWCWGGNFYAQLGLGADTDNRDAPARVGAATNWERVEAGDSFTCGLRPSGDRTAVWCWGRNESGELGRGAAGGPSGAPTQIAEPLDAAALAVGDQHACAIDQDAALWCWGENGAGQLGTGDDPSDHPDPLVVAAGTRWIAVSAGARHTCGIQEDASLWCWGDGEDGQLDGTVGASASAPERLAGATRWAVVAAGARHTCALDEAGALSCWGDNQTGALGLGDTLPRDAPERPCFPRPEG